MSSSKSHRKKRLSVLSWYNTFCTNDSFHVDFSVVNNGIKSKWLDGIPSYEEIKDMALYSFSLTIEKDKIIDFSYDFKPYSLLDKVSGRHVSYNDIKNTCYVVDDDGDNVDISSYKIGTIRMEGRIYDLDQKVLNVGLSSGGAALRLYLLQNGGVKVFRDNMRVWDYGEKDNDWLNLDSRRINNPSRSLSTILIKNYCFITIFVDIIILFDDACSSLLFSRKVIPIYSMLFMKHILNHRSIL